MPRGLMFNVLMVKSAAFAATSPDRVMAATNINCWVKRISKLPYSFLHVGHRAHRSPSLTSTPVFPATVSIGSYIPPYCRFAHDICGGAIETQAQHQPFENRERAPLRSD